MWAVLEDMACRKHHNNLESLKRSLVKVAADSACHYSTVAEASQRLALRPRAAISSGIIINKNFKILLLNYLDQKVDVLSRFPPRSECTWDRTYGRTVFITSNSYFYSGRP